MKNTVVKVLVIASVLTPAAAFAQAGKTAPTTATYIMKEEIDKVSATEQSQSTRDENVKVVDLGYENFAVGIVHRGTTRTPAPAGAGGGGAAAQAQPAGARWQLFLRAERREASRTISRPRAISSSPAAERCSPTATSSTDGTTIRTRQEDRTGRPAAGWRMA